VGRGHDGIQHGIRDRRRFFTGMMDDRILGHGRTYPTFLTDTEIAGVDT
jgi:hypothetical protein